MADVIKQPQSIDEYGEIPAEVWRNLVGGFIKDRPRDFIAVSRDLYALKKMADVR